jgi:hypothetical protein
VGHIPPDSEDEQSFPLVGRTNRRCWYDVRVDFVTFSDQTGVHGIEGEIDRSTNIFSNHESGSDFADDSQHFKPEA